MSEPFLTVITYLVYFRDTTGERAGGGWRLWSTAHVEEHEARKSRVECEAGRPWAETAVARETRIHEWVDAEASGSRGTA